MSEGALVVDVARGGDKKPMPPLILVKSDGGVLYGTTDLATIIERVREHESRPDPLCGGSPPARPFRAGVPRRGKGRTIGQGASGACRLRHHERRRRQAVQDPRRRGDEASTT